MVARQLDPANEEALGRIVSTYAIGTTTSARWPNT